MSYAARHSPYRITHLIDNRLLSRRAARHLSQDQLAKLVGLSRRAVNAIETGHSTPSLYTALKIARVLEAPVDELFQLAVPDMRTVQLTRSKRRRGP